MHGLVLAGGEGSRLLADGVSEPKAVVHVAGRPQVVRIVETFAELGCESVTCMVREGLAAIVTSVCRDVVGGFAHVIPCATPSSLHTLAEGVRRLPTGKVFCAMVDTVMRPDDWRTVYQEAGRHLDSGADAVLAVTSYVDDESPLWVERDAHGVVRGFPGSAVQPPCVTGGVYAFGPRARLEIEAAVAAGIHRVRGFLARLLESGARIATVDVPRIVDLDRKQDLQSANDWLLAVRV